jgi:phospholipase/carboxylesterase
MTTADLGFVHRFEPAPTPGDAPTLLLLHGTGGDENDLLPLGRSLDPTAALLSPRGPVMEGSMPRFFRRLAEGVFDHEDLVLRTHQLAEFVDQAATAYGLNPARITAVGFSNGANIAASLLLLHPSTLRGAVLLRAMVPFDATPRPDLTGTDVLIAAGRNDPIVSTDHPERLADMLRASGASVDLTWANAGHGLTQGDVDAAREWISRTR